MPNPLDIPEFLKLSQDDRRAAWDASRAPAAVSAEVTWRRNRDKLYEEEATAHARLGNENP